MKMLIWARLNPAARASSISFASSAWVAPDPRNSGLVPTFSIVQALGSPETVDMTNEPRGHCCACSSLLMPILLDAPPSPRFARFPVDGVISEAAHRGCERAVHLRHMEYRPVPPRDRFRQREILCEFENEGFIALQYDVEPAARHLTARCGDGRPADKGGIARFCGANGNGHAIAGTVILTKAHQLTIFCASGRQQL